MDDFRIYNRALSATEVSKLYTLTDKAQGGDCADTNNAIHPFVLPSVPVQTLPASA